VADSEIGEWLILNLPATAEAGDLLGRREGEPLWPERFDGAELVKIRRDVTERGWFALYQQRPRPLEGVLWQQPWIDGARWNTAAWGEWDIDLCQRIVTGVDPSGTATGDECGIVVAGIGWPGEPCPCGADPATSPLPHGYVMADYSLQAHPRDWARSVIRAYKEWDCDAICAEINFGADLVETNLQAVDADVVPTKLRASHGKAVRAEPVANLYQQLRIHHIGKFPLLEQEQLSWRPDSRWSPNRLDALVWDFHDLRLAGGTRVRVLA
jgi:phage terminase large subunit-like protein